MHLSLSRKMGPPICVRPVSRYCVDFPNIRIHRRISDALTLRCSQQMSPRHVQVDQPTSNKQPVGILLQAPVTDLVEAEDALEDEKRVFDPGPDSRFGAVLRALGVRQGLLAVAFLVRKILCSRGMLPDHLALSGIG